MRKDSLPQHEVARNEQKGNRSSLPVLFELLPGISAVDLGVLVDRTLVIADVHIGYEDELYSKDALVPRAHIDDTIQRLDGMINISKPHTIVINGDIKHDFGTISDNEWRDTVQLLDFLKSKCKKIILVQGNHDTLLKPLANKRGIHIKATHECKHAMILHGHTIIEGEKKIFIIGHEHPAFSLHEGGRKEVYKCFLAGLWKEHDLIVLPSFNQTVEGSDVLTGKRLSPYLKGDISSFRVYSAGKKILSFGTIEELSSAKEEF